MLPQVQDPDGKKHIYKALQRQMQHIDIYRVVDSGPSRPCLAIAGSCSHYRHWRFRPEPLRKSGPHVDLGVSTIKTWAQPLDLRPTPKSPLCVPNRLLSMESLYYCWPFLICITNTF